MFSCARKPSSKSDTVGGQLSAMCDGRVLTRFAKLDAYAPNAARVFRDHAAKGLRLRSALGVFPAGPGLNDCAKTAGEVAATIGLGDDNDPREGSWATQPPASFTV